MAVGIILIVWVGGWPVGTEHDRLRILSWQALGAMGGMMSVIVSLAIGGPVGRFKVDASGAGLNVEANGRDETPPAPVVAEADRALAAAHAHDKDREKAISDLKAEAAKSIGGAPCDAPAAVKDLWK